MQKILNITVNIINCIWLKFRHCQIQFFLRRIFMSKKNVCMEIKADQFESLNNEEAMYIDGGIDSQGNA